jgi:hypothetical protein
MNSDSSNGNQFGAQGYQSQFPAGRPFSIRIFCPDGNPVGLRKITKSNWTGCGIVCPRPILPTEKGRRKEFSKPGVYVLLGPPDDLDLTIYIGEADPVGDRLGKHYIDKDFWTWVVFFVSTDDNLNKAHIQHIESRLLDMARQANRARIENANNPQAPTLSEAEIADAESFLMDMLTIFPLLGVNVFKSIEVTNSTLLSKFFPPSI